MLMAARDEATGAGLDDEALRGEITTMIFAGHETTANTLTWACYLLAQQPDVEHKLFAEVEAVLNGRPPAMADLANLPYTRQVIDETLRLYPPAWGFGRQSIEADEIGGYPIAAKSNILIPIFAIHRHPAYWDEPERFDPERFDADRPTDRPRFVYLPFGGGPRVCIGQQFALIEATLILASIVQRCRLELVPGYVAQPEAKLTLTVANGLPMAVHWR
jgi:cytochrome P450